MQPQWPSAATDAQQLREEKIHIFAFQETRLRRLHRAHADDFFLFRSAANERGHFGIIVGFAKDNPYAVSERHGKQHQHRFKEDDFSIISQTPRSLILCITSKALGCIVLGQAPHENAIPKTYDERPILLLTDANAVVGVSPTTSIGDFQAGPHDSKSEPFENFIRRCGLWLPSTFEVCQDGPGHTCGTYTGGRERRIDFIGLYTLALDPQVMSSLDQHHH